MPPISSFRIPRVLALLGAALLIAVGAAGWAGTGWVSGLMVWLAEANQWLADTLILRMGYWGVFALMFIESSFIPFPSEIIIPPAADLARRLPDWSLTAVIVLGCAGSLAGALFNYALALYLGRPALLRLIDRFGPYVRITRKGYGKAERFFQRHGAISTFTGRLIPGIRQIISLPAGLARMDLWAFSLFTALGAGLWVVVLALLGYWFGDNAELLARNMGDYSRWLAGGMLLLIAGYALLYWRSVRRSGKNPPGRAGDGMDPPREGEAGP